MKRMLNQMLNRMLMIAALLVSANTLATPPGWSDTSTAAATGYCLAKHPYLSLAAGAFTSDGYEVVAPPGVVRRGARNYMYSRTSTTADEGRFNSCAAACKQFGRQYAPTYAACRCAAGAFGHRRHADHQRHRRHRHAGDARSRL